MSDDKPTTILESLQKMEGATIRRIILEAESFLKSLNKSTVISLLKTAVGLDIAFDVSLPLPDQKLTFLCSVRDDDWKKLGKFIISAGSLVDKAGIPAKFDIQSTGGAGAYCAIQFEVQIPAITKLFSENTSEDDSSIPVEAVLEYIEPDHDSDSR